MQAYSELEYPLDESSPKEYPQQLCNYLAEYFLLPRGKLLDIGCGKGFYVNAFRRLGYQAVGIDSDKCNFEKERLPYRANAFDIVFVKSTIEHIWNTQYILSEAKRVLGRGGIILCLTPDWSWQARTFYDDSTHIKPFTKKGLEQAFSLAGFRDAHCGYFYPTPFYWNRSYLNWLPYLARLLPEATKYRGGKQNKLIRFSKERMLLLSARP